MREGPRLFLEMGFRFVNFLALGQFSLFVRLDINFSRCNNLRFSFAGRLFLSYFTITLISLSFFFLEQC